MESAVARCSAGKISETIEWEGGDAPASPTPTPNRARNNCVKFCARPQSAVITLHMAAEIAIIFRRLLISAHRAIGILSVV